MKKIFLTPFAIVCVLAIGTIIAPLGATSPATATVFVNPSTITVTAGINYTVCICVKNVVGLYAWSIGMWWNPNALECVKFEEGPFLKSGGDTLLVSGTINNTAGKIYPPYGCTSITAAGVDGSGTLANLTFRAKTSGTFNVHPLNIEFSDIDGASIPINVVDVFAVVWDGGVYPVVVVNNMTGYGETPSYISDYAFNKTAKAISFNITGPEGLVAYCNVTIPKTLLRANETQYWTVLLDGGNITASSTITENDTHTFIYFEHTFSSTYKIQIKGAEVIPEFPTAIIVPLLIATTLVAFVLRKKARPIKRRESALTE